MNKQDLLSRSVKAVQAVRRFSRAGALAVVTACALLTASCGGGGAGEGASLVSFAGVSLAGLDISASSGQLKTGSTTAITITASAVLPGNVAAVNVPINFSSTGGVLSAGTVRTSATGQASVSLQAGADTTNRTVIVTAEGGGKTQSITIDLNGTTLSLQGTTNASLGQLPLNYTVVLTDGNGAAIANKLVTLSSSKGNTITPASVTTNSSGSAVFTVKPTNAGIDTLTATASGAIGTLALDVNAAGLTLTPNTAEMDIGILSTKTFTLNYTISGVPQVNKLVRGSISRGSITTPAINSSNNFYEVLTDGAGNATFTVTSSAVGTAVFTATVDTVGSISSSVEFVTSAASKSTIQATPSNIGPNITGQSQRSSILVTVSDANDNPVKNANVTFNISTGSGNLTASTATTDSNGRATVTYIAGATSTATNGVTINANISKGSYSVVKTTQLTVGGQPVYVSIETDNTVSPSGLFDTKSFAVGVIDSNGNPIQNATISASLVPLQFRKGNLTWNGTDRWVYASLLTCPNEDLNFNGVIDTNLNGVPSATEDYNGSTHLEPRQVASLTVNEPSPGAGPVTDSTGFATLSVKYAKGYALWAQYNIVVRALVSGSEGSATYNYVLAGADSDYTSQSVIPPGVNSPFGIVTTAGLASPQPSGFSGVQTGCVNPN